MKPKKRSDLSFKFKSKVFVWVSPNAHSKDNSGAWRFARIPEKISMKIKEIQKGRPRRGWGAVYADAKIRKTSWRTSIFPDRHSVTYLLPLKKEIRYEENLYDGKEVNILLKIFL